MVGRFVEVCRRRGLKINADKSKVMMLNEEEGLECEVHADGIRFDHVSEFKYFGCVLNESGIDDAVSQEGGEWKESYSSYQISG